MVCNEYYVFLTIAIFHFLVLGAPIPEDPRIPSPNDPYYYADAYPNMDYADVPRKSTQSNVPRHGNNLIFITFLFIHIGLNNIM